jgi:hypothetical protein
MKCRATEHMQHFPLNRWPCEHRTVVQYTGKDQEQMMSKTLELPANQTAGARP